MTTTKSDFMAAEEIKLILQGRDQAEQERIMRWVNESLGLKTIAPLPAPSATPSPAAAVSPAVPPPAHAPTTIKDIRTFVADKAPKTDIHLATTIAYFYSFVAPKDQRKESVTPKDLDDACRLARGCSLKRALITLNNAVRLGLLNRADRGHFKINSVGENLVAMTLPASGVNSNPAKPARKKRPKASGNSKAKK